MRQYFAYTFLLILLLFSCSKGASDENEKRVATYSIEGMVCEMVCGASLRKGLYETKAVDAVEVDYAEKRKENLIHVHYQAGKTNPKDMKKLIESLNDGQFNCSLKADKAEEKELSKTEEPESASTKNGGVDGLEASAENFQLPNLTELLNSLIY